MAEAPKLRLYNTLTRAKETFVPIDPANVRMYVCGPTVYDFAHIGNARPVIVFDVLYRLLRHLYGEKHVTYARNITDIDDKINRRAFERWTRKRPLLAEMRELTEGTTAQYEADVAALGCLPPDHTPRATDFVCNGEKRWDMVRVIEKLVERGVAYAAEGHVLFSPKAMDQLPGVPGYGKLSRRPLDEMIAGARVDVAPYKRDPMDFVLWKPSDRDTEPGWESPWGFGRPGWHIECSAMSAALLGETFDIHAGGIDLIFPHHENEIAQTCCAFGLDKMASVWMHNGFLQVEGQKMSKSLGNFVTIDELLSTEKFGGRKWPGEVLRLVMLKTHYRQPIDWTVRGLEDAESKLQSWRAALSTDLGPVVSDEGFWLMCQTEATVNGKLEPILVALAEDMNTHTALSALDGFFSDYRKAESSNKELRLREFAGCAAFLGILGASTWQGSVRAVVEDRVIAVAITTRLAARRAKNFAESDRIRDELLAMGIQLKDGKDPVTGEPTTTWEVKR
jgi:cysteinyl-tRNA synthetase